MRRAHANHTCIMPDSPPAPALPSPLPLSEQVLFRLDAKNKKQCLQALCERAESLCGQEARALMDMLQEREKLGSTIVGQGVALPHARLAALREPLALLARLAAPIDFDLEGDSDHNPVDVVFMLLLPAGEEEQHQSLLARWVRALRKNELAQALRAAPNAAALHQLVAG